MSDRIRIAVIGAGHLGRIHARRIADQPLFELVGIADPIAESCRPLAQELCVPSYANHRELLGRMDAAVVATPTIHHHAVAVDLLQRGVHVLVEKPIANTSAEATALVAAAGEHARVLQVGHVERFNPAFAAIAARVREPRLIQAERRGGYSFRSTDIGVVLDLMIHDIDLTLALAQAPVEHVEATGVALFGRHEDLAQARLTFANGCVATLIASRASHTAARTMQVWSPTSISSADFTARTAAVAHVSAAVQRGDIDAARMSPAERESWKPRLLDEHLPLEHFAPPSAGDAISAELADFGESIRAGRAPRVTGRHGLEALVVAERILQCLAEPQSAIIPGPHWLRRPAIAPSARREAG